MTHPFGDLVSQHLHRKHGLSQSRLAAGIMQEPTIITRMCKGERLSGHQARERVVAIIRWLHLQGTLASREEANTLLDAAGMSALHDGNVAEEKLITELPSLFSTLTPPLPVRGGNLPAPVSELIGREKDTMALTQLMRQKTVRVVTLIGPPGVGKTRLAQQAAWELRNEFPNGAWFVALAPITDASLVAASIAQTLELPDTGAPPVSALKNYLRDKHILLVLDNFEQLLAASSVVAELAADGPDVKVLITSRAALHIAGEHTLDVPPLDQTAAMALFAQRAQAVTHDFAITKANSQALTDICKRLEGLPLAIELAAARMRLFAPEALLARLYSQLYLLTTGASDVPPHQRTLRGTIDWSYSLLTEEEQRFFCALSVFAGGCTLESAESVAGAGLSVPAIDLMQSLVDKSLVRVETRTESARFGMLEMLREYARERLISRHEANDVHQRHMDYLISYCRDADIALRGQEMLVWIRRFDSEQDNIRGALTWALQSQSVEPGLQLAKALGYYWFIAVRQNEGWSWISRLITRPDSAQYPELRANLLMAAIPMLRHIGDDTEAERAANESLALSRQLGDKAAMAQILSEQGCNAWSRADYARGIKLCEESIGLFRELGDHRGVAWVLTWFGSMARDRGRLAEAAAYFQECADNARQVDDSMITWCAMNGIATVAYAAGDYALAEKHYRDTLQFSSKINGDWAVNYVLMGLGIAVLAQGDIDLGAQYLEVGEQWARRTHHRNMSCNVLHQLGFARHVQGNQHASRMLMREALIMQRDCKRHFMIAESLDRIAWIAADLNDLQRAARLLGAAAAYHGHLGAPISLGDIPFQRARLEALKAALGDAALTALWNEGYAMNVDEAAEYALTTEEAVSDAFIPHRRARSPS